MLKTKFVRIVIVALISLFAFSAVAPAYAAAPAADAAASGKRIVVYLNQQRLYAYSGNTLVTSMAVHAIGTRRGNFSVQNRLSLVNSIVRGFMRIAPFKSPSLFPANRCIVSRGGCNIATKTPNPDNGGLKRHEAVLRRPRVLEITGIPE